MFAHGLALLLFFGVFGPSLYARPAAAQVVPDTTGRDAKGRDIVGDATAHSWLDDHTPRGALWRAAALPGWGQYYNRQYLKIPVVYAALGGVAALAINQNRQYRRYDRAFLYRAWEDAAGTDGENPFSHFKPEYDALVQDFGFQITAEPLRQQRDNFRRNRDFSFIGIGLLYGLSILDAYISAHLLDFDISEDLTAALRPHHRGLSLSLRLGL